MPAGAQRRAASKHAERAGRSLGRFGGGGGVGFEEAGGVEGFGVGPEERGVVVDGGAGHLHDGVFSEEVLVRDEGVGEDFADGGVGRSEAHGFLVDGDEEGAVGAEFGDVDAVGRGGVSGGGRGGGRDDGSEFGAEGLEEGGAREDVEGDPEGGGDDVGEDAEEDGGLALGDVGEGEAVAEGGAVADFDEVGAALLAALAEVFAEGGEEELSGFVGFWGEDRGEGVCAKGGDVTFKVPVGC